MGHELRTKTSLKRIVCCVVSLLSRPPLRRLLGGGGQLILKPRQHPFPPRKTAVQARLRPTVDRNSNICCHVQSDVRDELKERPCFDEIVDFVANGLHEFLKIDGAIVVCVRIIKKTVVCG